MKRFRIKKIKFIRSILVCIVAVIIVAFILNITPGYKRDTYTDVINLIINEENVTEQLKNQIYISEKGTIYMSKEDIANLFDSTIYYDETYNQIITTSNTKVANIIINEKQMIVNNSKVSMLEPVVKINNKIYIPISDMTLVYNIKMEFIESTNRVVIDELNRGMIKADVLEDTKIKFKPRALSKDIKEIKTGDVVCCYYTTSKGWRQIRTSDGIIGYIKANKLTNEYIIRQDLAEIGESTKISLAQNKDGYINVNNEKILLREWFNLDDIETESNIENSENSYKIWATVSNKLLENQTNIILSDYKSRTALIDKIVTTAMTNNINGINLNFTGITNQDMMLRFVIELSPKLRELGISTSIVLNDDAIEEKYKNIVEYIAE